MLATCPRCGLHRPDAPILEKPSRVRCPDCGHERAFTKAPLLIVSGAAGVGKSSALALLLGRIQDAVLIESDLVWFGDGDSYFDTCLRLAAHIGQSGRPAVLFGAGIGVPENIEARPLRRFLGPTRSLALVCDPEVHAARLRGRQRDSGREDFDAFLKDHQGFNRWFREQGPSQDPAIELLDTTRLDREAVAAGVGAWIRRRVAVP